jgi:hypothetical protein
MASEPETITRRVEREIRGILGLIRALKALWRTNPVLCVLLIIVILSFVALKAQLHDERPASGQVTVHVKNVSNPVFQVESSGAPKEVSKPSAEEGNSFSVPDEEIRLAIDKRLDREDLVGAILQLSSLREGIVKREECQRLYEYALVHGIWEKARKIVDQCWKGEARDAKNREIWHERLKQW